MDRLTYLLSGGFINPWLLGATKDKIYNLTLTSATEVTPVGISASSENAIVGGVLHGLGVFTNGVNAPVYWNGTTVNTLTNWPSGYICGMLRPFKNFLFAGNISIGGNDYPTKLLWSTAADPGALPDSWAETDPTKDSGSVTLSDTPGKIIDGMQCADSFYVYKEDAIYELRYVGGVYVFSAHPRFKTFGVMAKNSVISVNNQMFALGNDDIVTHNAVEIKSIASRFVRKRLFNGIVNTYQDRTFVIYDAMYKEILFCVPWNSEYPDHAFTYNYTTGKWGERDLPQVGCGTSGKILSAADSWNSDTQEWDLDNTSWGTALNAISYTFLGGASLYGLNETFQHGGVSPKVMMERKSIDFGTAVEPNERIKFISTVRPNIVANAGVIVQVAIGTQMKLGDPVNWATPQNFIVGTTRDLHFRLNGRYISWRVYSQNDDFWKLESIDFDVKQGAMW